MLLINKSKLPQIISVPGKAFPITIFPGMVFNPIVVKNFKIYDAFEEFNVERFRNVDKVGFFRSYALGDIIQLIPVARYFKKIFNIKRIEIATKMNLIQILRYIFRDIGFFSDQYLNHIKDVPYFNLDSILELDHNIEHPYREKHRIDIYFENIGISSYVKEELDWSNSIRLKELNVDMNTTRKKIGIQIRGSTDIKTLKLDTVKQIVNELAKEYTVYLIHHAACDNFNGDNIVNTCGKLNVIEVVSLLTKMDCCITMDSGILWLAHSANCPVIAILGSTREHERISLHPQYPKKAKAINIAEEIIGCTPCFETKKYCGGKMNCMNNFDKDKLITLIKTKLNEILGD